MAKQKKRDPLTFFKAAQKIVMCRLLDLPLKPELIASGVYQGQGDYGDQWGRCSRCGGLLHRDAHLFGDSLWYHEAPKLE